MLVRTTAWLVASALFVAPRLTGAEKKAVRGSGKDEHRILLPDDLDWTPSGVDGNRRELLDVAKHFDAAVASATEMINAESSSDRDHRHLALVGSYRVQDGPAWPTNPPTYTCQEACALLFGGAASSYHCSTSGTSIDHTGWTSGWGQFGCIVRPENYKLNTFYNCGFSVCAISAYVSDWCFSGETNYCYTCDANSDSYYIWDSATDTEVEPLTDGWSGCIAEPYNIEVRPCAHPDGLVQLKLWTTAGGTIHRQKEYDAPYFLWGNHGANVDINDAPLPDGIYKLNTVINGQTKTITFTQDCVGR